MAKKQILCDFCNKNYFWATMLKRFVIWIVKPVKNEDGSIMYKPDGEMVHVKVNMIDAKKELLRYEEAERYAYENLKDTLKADEAVLIEKIELPKDVYCPSCRRTERIYKNNIKKAEAKRRKLGIKQLTPEESIAMIKQDIDRKVFTDFKQKQEKERKNGQTQS